MKPAGEPVAARHHDRDAPSRGHDLKLGLVLVQQIVPRCPLTGA